MSGLIYGHRDPFVTAVHSWTFHAPLHATGEAPSKPGVRVTRSPFTDWHPVDSVGSPPFCVATHHLGTSRIRRLRLLFVLAAESRREHAVGIVLLDTNVIAATRRCRCPFRPKAPEDPELRGRRGKPRAPTYEKLR